MRARVLLILPTTTYRTHDFLEAANRLGVELVVATNRRQALSRLIPHTSLALSFRNYDLSVQKIQDYAGSFPLQAVLGVEEETVELAALASQALGLPHNPMPAVRAARYKHLMRQTLAQAGLPSPWFKLVPLDEVPEKTAPGLSYPCVMKPTFLSGSRGVRRVNSPKEFVSAFRQTRMLLQKTEVRRKGLQWAEHVLVEEYIPGDEVAVEGILIHGVFKPLAIFDKPDPLTGPFFVETIYLTPSRLPVQRQADINGFVQRMADALGLWTGPVHVELRLNEHGLWPVEIAARSIGGLCSRILRFEGDMSLEELILRQALGEDISSVHREPCASGVMMMPVPRAGVLKEVRGLAEARGVPGIEDVLITIARETQVAPPPEESRYLGFIFARGETPQKVEATLRSAYEKLEVVIEEQG